MTISAPRDANGIPAIIVASSADGITPTTVYVDSGTHALYISDGITGTDHGVPAAVRDSNYIPVAMGVSSADGVTPTEIYGDPVTHRLLVKST